MPPKRKAAATVSESEPPQTRRRTRSTAVTTQEPQQPAELPPARQTRRRVNVQEEAEPDVDVTKPSKKVASVRKATSRAVRTSHSTAARNHKAQTEQEDVPEPERNESKRSVRGKKVQPEEDEQAGHAGPPQPDVAHSPPRPLSPVQEKTVPKVARKRTRSTKTVDEVKPQTDVTEDSRPKRTRRAKANEQASNKEAVVVPEKRASEAEEHSVLDETIPTTPKKKRGRQKGVPAKGGNTVKEKVSSPVKAALQPPPPPLVASDDEESSEDELLLSPSKRQNSVRPSTPVRASASRVGTPRMILHSVEITTPMHILTTIRKDRGSPVPRTSAHIPPLGTPRLPPAFPSVSDSPAKHAVLAPPVSKSRRSYARTPSPEPAAPPQQSPSRSSRRAAPPSPAKRQQPLPDHLHPLLERQQHAILKALQHPPEVDEIEIYGEDYPPTNTAAYEQLSELLTGSVVRGEGNSCMLIGPSGSGKTEMVERSIKELPGHPIVVRLSGYAQHNDRLAIREIAWQLAQQTGQSFLPNEPEDAEDGEVETADMPAPTIPKLPPQPEVRADLDEDEDDENPFVDSAPALSTEPIIALPPPSHLLALISMIPTLPRPTIVVLDGFDLFAGHARQALLYCLLDTAQACRAGTGAGAGSGMAVVGVTARVDTLNLLEKRVKSRFSGRMIRTAGPARMSHWVALARAVLSVQVVAGENVSDGGRDEKEWNKAWAEGVERFLEDERVIEVLRETYALTRDFQMFRRIMTCLVLEFENPSPYPKLANLKAAVNKQRCPARYPPLHTLPYPAICLLIASVHASTSGHDVFTFEMLYEAFKTQVRTSQSAPVQIAGGGIGMVRCSREVLFSAFERLISLRIFLAAAAPSVSIAKEFAMHRSTVERFAVRQAVDKLGQFNLKKWLTKA